MILLCYITRQFAMNVLSTCPPRLSDVATLPWEIQVIFNSIINTQKGKVATSDSEVVKCVRYSCQIF